MLVADQRGLRHQDGVLQLVFDGLRRDQLAAGGLEQFLLAVGDVEESVVVEVADIAGAEPAFGVEALCVGVGLLPVADKDGRTADEQFAIFGELELDVGQRLADSAHAVTVGMC